MKPALECNPDAGFAFMSFLLKTADSFVVLQFVLHFKMLNNRIFCRVINNVRNGSIIVFHDSSKAQTNLEYALPRFIEHAKEKGFEFEKVHHGFRNASRYGYL